MAEPEVKGRLIRKERPRERARQDAERGRSVMKHCGAGKKQTVRARIKGGQLRGLQKKLGTGWCPTGGVVERR